MSEKASAKDLELIKKGVLSGERALSDTEKKRFDYAMSKRVSIGDVLDLMGLYYPEPSKEELDLMTRFIEKAGTMKLTKEENLMFDKMANKRVSMKAMTQVVMAAYRNQLATNYYNLREQLFHVQIIIRDYMVTSDGLKRAVEKLHKNKNIDDKAYHTLMASHLKMTKREYKDALETAKKAEDAIVDKMNAASDALDRARNGK